MFLGSARLAVLLTLVVGGPVHAQDYSRTRVDGKNICIAWQNRVYTYHVHTKGSARTPQEAEFAAVDAAFRSWAQLAETCTDFRFVKGDPVDSVFIGYRQGQRNQNVVTFRETSCLKTVPASDVCWVDKSCGNKHECWDGQDGTIALTTTTFSYRSGTIYDADVEFNAAPHADNTSFLFTTVSSPPCSETNVNPLCVANDIQNTLTHEIGHIVGLDHVQVPGSTMEASAPVGETNKRIIDDGSAAGFCETYPAGAPTPPCDPSTIISREITAENKGTNTGCSVGGEGWAAAMMLTAAAFLRRERRRRVR